MRQKRDVLAGIEALPCIQQKLLCVCDGGAVVERIGRVRVKFAKLAQDGVLVVSPRRGGSGMRFLRGAFDKAVGHVDAQKACAHPLLDVAGDDGRLGVPALRQGNGVGLHDGEAFHVRHRHVQINGNLPAAGVYRLLPAVRTGFFELRNGLKFRVFCPCVGQADHGQCKTGTRAKQTVFHVFSSCLSSSSHLRQRSKSAPDARFGR